MNMKYFVRAIRALVSDKLGRVSRKAWRNQREKARLKNSDFTIFAQNCIGSVMYHDLGLQFDSPTINLLLPPKDFVRFMKEIHYYLEQPITFQKTDKSSPVGDLDGLTVHFIHYKTEQEALSSWKKRIERIHWDKVFVICCDEGLTYDDMADFDHLPYQNKILFMHKADPSIKCGIYTKDFQDKTDARLLEFCNLFGKRYYQRYVDYVKWLNEGNYWC